MTPQPPADLCHVTITAPDPDWLLAFTSQLVDDRLAAVAHQLPVIRSIYHWQGKRYDRHEAVATLHTRTALLPDIRARLDMEHPYETPGIVAVPICDTSPDYAAWVIEQTQ